jgi:hypothetical protein
LIDIANEDIQRLANLIEDDDVDISERYRKIL